MVTGTDGRKTAAVVVLVSVTVGAIALGITLSNSRTGLEREVPAGTHPSPGENLERKASGTSSPTEKLRWDAPNVVGQCSFVFPSDRNWSHKVVCGGKVLRWSLESVVKVGAVGPDETHCDARLDLRDLSGRPLASDTFGKLVRTGSEELGQNKAAVSAEQGPVKAVYVLSNGDTSKEFAVEVSFPTSADNACEAVAAAAKYGAVVASKYQGGPDLRIEAEVSKKPPDAELPVVAEGVRDSLKLTGDFQRVVVFFRVRGMLADGMAWARVDLAPEVRSEVLGMTADQELELKKRQPPVDDRSVIGSWVFENPPLALALRRSFSGVVLDRWFPDGPVDTRGVTEENVDGVRVFRIKEAPPTGKKRARVERPENLELRRLADGLDLLKESAQFRELGFQLPSAREWQSRVEAFYNSTSDAPGNPNGAARYLITMAMEYTSNAGPDKAFLAFAQGHIDAAIAGEEPTPGATYYALLPSGALEMRDNDGAFDAGHPFCSP